MSGIESTTAAVAADGSSIDMLATLFTSAARAHVLKLFMLDPRRAYYQRQIEAATGLPIRAVQRELERLSALGLLYRRSEGNRAYYQVDMLFPLFPELRSLVLKTCSRVERIRGILSMDESVRLAFLNADRDRALIVTGGGVRPNLRGLERIQTEIMTLDEFTSALADPSEDLQTILNAGEDLLGRREDVAWRRIESAGFDVRKGKGVA